MKKQNEAVVVLAKCGQHHKTYGIRAEKIGLNHWEFNWAFPIKEEAAKREGYDKTILNGIIETSPQYPGCPYCGRTYYAICDCGHVGCIITDDGTYHCEWCHCDGELEDGSEYRVIAGMDV